MDNDLESQPSGTYDHFGGSVATFFGGLMLYSKPGFGARSSLCFKGRNHWEIRGYRPPFIRFCQAASHGNFDRKKWTRLNTNLRRNFNSQIKKSNLRSIRAMTSKHVTITRGGVRLRGLSPGQHRAEENQRRGPSPWSNSWATQRRRKPEAGSISVV